MKIKFLIICILSTIGLANFSYQTFAQEFTVPNISFTRFPENILKTNYQKTNNTDTLELPFFDDFSTYTGLPDSKLWTHKNITINQTLAVLPVSTGTATFDASQNSGAIYQAVYNTPFRADELTSRPINLNYPGNTTIFLSFYYQPQGFCDEPEDTDSLIVEFYSPNSKNWDKIWAVKGSALTPFTRQIIQVKDAKYLVKGFQFRFRNIASLSQSTIPSKVGNADFWNIDYVKLDKNRTIPDTIPHDISFVYPLQFKFGEYQNIPWNHYKTAVKDGKIKSTFKLTYRNNDNQIRLLDSLKITISDEKKINKNDTIFIGTYNLAKNQNITLNNTSFNYKFQPNTIDSGIYKMKSIIITSGFDLKSNNTSQIIKEFTDYYAYDDGTAEKGYGIFGEGTQGAMLAYKFFPLCGDSLKAVRINFTQTLFDASKKYFYLAVWDNNPKTGMPNKLLVKREGKLPAYGEIPNTFITYKLDTSIFVKDTFYIGWIQTTTDMLNIGLDANQSGPNHKYLNINGNWQRSQIDGELLFRPVFKNSKDVVTQTNEITNKPSGFDFNVYPNPADNFIHIELDAVNKNYQLQISDNLGRLLNITKITNNQTTINLSGFPSGLYLIRILNENQIISTKKIIIRH